MKPLTRRAMIAVGALVAVGGTALRFARPFGRRRPLTPYDDLLAALDDRDAGVRVGKAALARNPRFDLGAVAANLRTELKGRSFAALARADIDSDRMGEAGGWVLPETALLLCAVAARA